MVDLVLKQQLALDLFRLDSFTVTMEESSEKEAGNEPEFKKNVVNGGAVHRGANTTIENRSPRQIVYQIYQTEEM